jgi:DNA-binding NarL/FixJ family response regulator
MTNKLSIMVVEDEPEFQRRFTEAVTREDAFELLGVASTIANAKTMIDEEQPDVMLVDLGMPDASGIEIIKHCAEKYPDTDIMVITVFDDEMHVVDSIEAGATGYLLKDTPQEEFVDAIKTLHAGGSPVSPVVARHVLERFRASKPRAAVPVKPATPVEGPEVPLSARETQILQLLAKGFSFNEIGELLDISPYTVATHIKKIYRKLAVNSRGQAVYEATQMGLLGAI